IEFSVPPTLGLGAGDEARLEFRFFHMGNADLTIASVDLRHEPGREIQTAARVWRMLGRLEKTAIGRRTRNGVTVRRIMPAGRLLEGGRPYLQLPQGDYRLTFDCDIGIPRMPSQPVLGVEVVAWRRWHDRRAWNWGSLVGLPPPINGVQQAWRDFTAGARETGCH